MYVCLYLYVYLFYYVYCVPCTANRKPVCHFTCGLLTFTEARRDGTSDNNAPPAPGLQARRRIPWGRAMPVPPPLPRGIPAAQRLPVRAGTAACTYRSESFGSFTGAMTTSPLSFTTNSIMSPSETFRYSRMDFRTTSCPFDDSTFSPALDHSLSCRINYSCSILLSCLSDFHTLTFIHGPSLQMPLPGPVVAAIPRQSPFVNVNPFEPSNLWKKSAAECLRCRCRFHQILMDRRFHRLVPTKPCPKSFKAFPLLPISIRWTPCCSNILIMSYQLPTPARTVAIDCAATVMDDRSIRPIETYVCDSLSKLHVDKDTKTVRREIQSPNCSNDMIVPEKYGKSSCRRYCNAPQCQDTIFWEISYVLLSVVRMRLDWHDRKTAWEVLHPVIDVDVPHCKIGHNELSLGAAHEGFRIR